MDTTIICLLLASALGTPTYLYWRRMMRINQRKHDLNRDTFVITYPLGLTEDRPTAFINGIGSTLNVDITRNGGIPTIVFEVVATDRGIEHRMRFPSFDDEYLIGLLEASIPGMDISPCPDEDDVEYDFAVRLFMSYPHHPLKIANAQDYTTRLLKAIQTDHPGERVTLQWVVADTNLKKDETRIVHPSFTKALLVGSKPTEEPLSKGGRRATNEQHFVASGRIAAKAGSVERAQQLVRQVLRGLQSENDHNKIYAVEIKDFTEVTEARTPIKNLGALFSTSELVANIASPIGDPSIPGLRQGAARRFPATENIAREGWVFGHSDVSGRPRPVALALPDVLRHVVLVGAPGTGKTVFANQGLSQIIDAGFGAIVMDAGTDISRERLYYRQLDTMPAHRIVDVILINPAADRERSVSINLLDQGFGTAIIDIIIDTYVGLYPSIADTVNFREIVKHGLLTLIEHGGYTIIDLPSLIAPRNPAERQWANRLIDTVKDPELRDFWARNPGAKATNDTKWERKTEPVLNKLWNLTLDPSVRYLFGQTKSTVNIRQALRDNKIVMVSLGGMDPQAAQQVANLLTTMIWRATQVMEDSGTRPEQPNVLFVDEFQIISGSHATIADMLARARALGLGLVLATQFISRQSIQQDLRDTVLRATNTQIVFKAEGREASIWAQQLGRSVVTDADITRIPQFHGIARMPGESSPVTFSTLRPLTPIPGRARQVQARSNDEYARPVEEIRREIDQRRQIHREPRKPRPQGEQKIDPEED